MADQRVYARTFSQTLTLVAGLFCLEKRVSYRRLRKEFDLDDEILNDRRADIGFPGSRLRAQPPGTALGRASPGPGGGYRRPDGGRDGRRRRRRRDTGLAFSVYR